jgi:hypothetical protein
MRLRHWLFTSKGKTYLLEEYVRKERSIYDISDGVDVYPNLIRRALLAHSIPRRDLSEAQKVALKTGRQAHPTEGRSRTKQERDAIAGGQERAWQNATPESLERRRERARGQWAAMSDEERQRSVGRAQEATRAASVTGSRLAMLVAERLREDGFEAHVNRPVTSGGQTVRADVYLPVERIAVEVLGPAFHRPIWGEGEHARTLEAAARKLDVLRSAGTVITLRYRDRLTRGRRLQALDRTLAAVIEAASTAPPNRAWRIFDIDIDHPAGEKSGK